MTPYQEIANGTLTDLNGQIVVPISQGGIYDVYVLKEGYLPSNGSAVVECDLTDCGSCSATVTLEVDQPRCPDVVLPVTIKDEETGKPVENAQIKVVLTSSLSGPSLLPVDVPKYTNENGTATFDIDMNGDYSIEIEADGYDSKILVRDYFPLYRASRKRVYIRFSFIPDPLRSWPTS